MAVSFVPGWTSGPGPLGAIAVILIILLTVLLFGGMTRAALSGGGPVERPNRVRQWYGYTVCLIAIVTGLICVSGVLDRAFDLSDPLAQENPYSASLYSFAAYQADMSGDSRLPGQGQTASDTTSAATLRAQYEALRADRIAQLRFVARKGLVTDVILLVIAVALFVTHWRWLRQFATSEETARAA